MFSVVGGSVGIYGGWSIAEEIRTDGRWTVESLVEAMDGLPRKVTVTSQIEHLTAEADK